MAIYAIVVTLIAVALWIRCFLYKKALRAVTLFAKEQYREPTKEEISNYTKRAVAETFKPK